MAKPVVFGAGYSVYVRAVRLALEEKGVAYDLEPVDVFAPDGPGADYLQRQPFGRIPAFEHDGFRLYEAGAIARYVDEAFSGPPLQPAAPRARACMNQAISIFDSYAYRTLVWDIFVERVRQPQRGREPDAARIAAAVPKARTVLRALQDLLGEAPWLAGDRLSLADLHGAPMIDYFHMALEGAALLDEHPRFAAWWARIAARKSMQRTHAPREAG